MQLGLGVALSVTGNCLISLGLVATKRAHMIVQEKIDKTGDAAVSYLMVPMWWLGLFGTVGGEVGNFLAYGYAPMTLVSPLGAVSVLSNALLAYFLLKEPLNLRNAIGCAIALAGAVTVSVNAPTGHLSEAGGVCGICTLERMLQRTEFDVYISVVLGLLAICILLANRLRYLILDLTICALLGAITVICAKGLSVTLWIMGEGGSSMNPHPALSLWRHHWAPYAMLPVLLFAVVLQLRYLNIAMSEHNASRVVPVYYCLFTVSCLVAGILMYQEYTPSTIMCCGFDADCPSACNLSLGVFAAGVVATFGGVFLVSWKETDQEPLLPQGLDATTPNTTFQNYATPSSSRTRNNLSNNQTLSNVSTLGRSQSRRFSISTPVAMLHQQ